MQSKRGHNTAPAIVWFRQDLRLADNTALDAAIGSKRPLVLLYILDDETPGRWRLGGASRWWLHKSLGALARDIGQRGARLTLRRGRAENVLAALIAETGAQALYWQRQYEPYAVARDTAVKARFTQAGLEAASFGGALLFEPSQIKNQAGAPFKVYSPFWRACLAQSETREPLPCPRTLPAFKGALDSDALDSWGLLPKRPNWAAGFEPEWSPGEAGAHAALQRFVSVALRPYSSARNLLGAAGTSRLSPHLHFGEISPLQVRAAIESAAAEAKNGAAKFQSELGWREFNVHLLYHVPHLPERPLRPAFDAFPWRADADALEAWRRGRTGYPIVDAAMRELWVTGYMHNRARMIAASFLIKHLLIDWRSGADWFWDTLVDADLANNAASWQWVAGSGADAAPYFRIFNPVLQGEKHDADGAYVRRWLPQLAALPDDMLHRPWEADAAILRAAGVALGRDYPLPIVDHGAARKRALDAFARISA
jgi:deoxyribodipyrimidine photo-lyase